jgi:hypothetical protein
MQHTVMPRGLVHLKVSTTVSLARLQDAAVDNMVNSNLFSDPFPLTPAEFDMLTRLQHQTSSKIPVHPKCPVWY